jgi:RNA polymerase sigma-70 factor (ECF subfamily)
VSIHEGLAEEIYGAEPHHGLPERDFDRSWAATLVRRVLDELRSEHESRGKAALFTALQPLLTGEAPPGAYEQIGKQLGMESGAVKVALHRARRRFGELLRREVAHTVERPEDVESELRALLSTMAGQFDA